MFAVYLAYIPLVYLTVMLSLSGVRKLGLKNARGNVHFRKKKAQRKEDDLVNLVSVTYAIRLICKYNMFSQDYIRIYVRVLHCFVHGPLTPSVSNTSFSQFNFIQ